MAYRHDPDLEFLGTLSSEELNDLVYLLTHDTDEKTRWTEFLTSNAMYKRCYPDHHQYWQVIAEEIQLFGGNSFANFWRGGLFSTDMTGVFYKEVLCDVCDKMKVNYNKKSPTKQIEQNLLMKILEESLEKMSPEEINNLAVELGLQEKDLVGGPQAMQAIFLYVFKAGGFRSYQITLQIANAVMKALFGKGLTFAGNQMLTKFASIITGPIGWAITAIWTAHDIAGAAYRVTIPAVIQVAYLRSLAENREAIELAEQIKF